MPPPPTSDVAVNHQDWISRTEEIRDALYSIYRDVTLASAEDEQRIAGVLDLADNLLDEMQTALRWDYASH